MSFACFTISCVVVYLPQRTEPSFLAARVCATALSMSAEEEHKYIIVGGGTAGCVLANRLSSEKVRYVSLFPSLGCGVQVPGILLLNLPRMFFFFISHKKESPQFSCRFSVFLSLKSRQKNCSTSYLQATRIRFARTAFGSVHVPTFQLN